MKIDWPDIWRQLKEVGVTFGFAIMMVAGFFLFDSVFGTEFTKDWPGTYIGKFLMAVGLYVFGYVWFRKYLTFTMIFEKIRGRFLQEIEK